MKFRPSVLVLGLITILSLACANGGDPGDDDDDGDETLILDGSAACDPTASALDDLFIFEVETVSGVDSVEVDVYVGSSRTGTVDLDERGDGNWYGEEDADDLDADCDDWNSMSFEYTAYGDEDSDSAQVVP